jgi:hypothetical protein
MTPWEQHLLETLSAIKARSGDARSRLGALSELRPDHAFDSLLLRSLAPLSEGSINPYVDDRGFRAFIRGGGNVTLYERLSQTLEERLTGAPARLLDIGAGDGIVYEPLPGSLFSSIDLVEPSPMLASAERVLRGKQVAARGHSMTIEAFLEGGPPGPWDAALASFSLHCLPSSKRAAVLPEIRRRSGRLFIAEFDVPLAARGSAEERFGYMIGRYRRGLEEYPENGTLVAEGFLVPIFLSAFFQEHVSYEQGLEDWKNELERAGFTSVKVWPLHPYWWADAFLLEAAP